MAFTVEHSFDYHFTMLLDKLEKKYGTEMFELEGIDRKHLDIAKFTNKFLETKTTADISVDANANVDDMSILSWNYEMPKPLAKLNSLYHLWKDALRKHGIKRANKFIELEIAGAIRIHDLHGWLMPYSYYRETPIVIRINKGQPKVITMKQLFDIYEEQKIVLSDREYIDLTKAYKKIGYENVPIMHLSERRNYYNFKNTSNINVYEHHNIEVLDGNGEWTELQQVLRHKRDVNMVAYQLNSGDYSVVTANHPVILEDGSEINAEDLKEGMKIKLGNTDVFKNLATEYIEVPEEFAYFLGFILGDGNVGRHKFNSKNNNLLDSDLCINVTAFEGGITIYQKDIKNTKIYQCVRAILPDMDDLERKSVNVRSNDRISFGNKTIRLLMAKYFGLDYGNSSRTKNLPINILSWTKHSKLAFIAGLIDAEGSVGQNGKIEVRMSAMAIMASLKEVLVSVGINSIKRICGNTFENFYGISFDGTTELQKYSVKLSKVEIKEINHNHDTFNRENTVKKVDIFNPDTDIKLAYNLDEEDSEFYYVYDITTASHTFYSNGMTQHNCWAASLAPIVNVGMPWVKNIKVGPVKHFTTFISNSIKYIYNLSTQCVGAIAVPDFLAYAEYFIRKDFGEEWYNDPKSVRDVEQGFQQWIYGVNDKARGNQSPFTNVSVFDKYWRKAMFEKHTNPDFTTCNLENLKRVQRFFVETLVKEQENNIFTFPVMTGCQLKDKETGEILDKDWLDWISGISVKNKLINFYTSDTCDSLSSCCRLRNNINPILAKAEQKEYSNSFGVGGLSIGSHRVVAINLPQIAYISKYSEKDSWEEFWRILESRIKSAQDILDIHRELLTFLIKNGNLPMYQYGCMDLSKQYSTLGFIGLYECLEIMGLDLTTDEGLAKGKEIIGLFNKLNDERTKLDGYIRNVEQIPGESAAVTFAAKDSLQFANVEYDLYANQYIPLIKNAPLTERIRLQGEFDASVSGGSILHLGVDNIMTKEQIAGLIQLAAKNNVIYFAIDDCLSQCKTCGKVHVGRLEKSPCHSSPVKYWQRVVGFRTPVESWNKVRRTKDFPNRMLYHDMPF